MFRSAPIAVALTALVSWFSIQLRAPEWSGHVPEALETEIVVAIQLEKTRFLQNERIFLWTVTQRAEGERRPISGPQLDDGRVIYTRPDGTIRIDRMSAPIDGAGVRNPFDLGFRGGWTLSDEAPQIGRWSVVYEMGNARSAPAEFTIEAPAAFKGLEAYFEFSTPRVYSPAATATLAVRNGSREVLRFVEPGQNYSIVWGHLHGGKHNGSLSIPEYVLAAATSHKHVPVGVPSLDWESIRTFPHVTIAPGATWRLQIPLSPWLARDYGRDADALSLSTELQLVIGEPDGEWREFSPVRWIATGTTKVRTP